jgi:hypothetical protein
LLINAALIAAIVLFSSCGYHIKTLKPKCDTTFSVTSFLEDRQGRFKEELIKAVSSYAWSYCPEGSRYVIECTLVDASCEQVGYRYDRYESTSQVINRLIPIEGRKKINVCVSVEDTYLGKTLGPFTLEGRSDFDFVNYDTYKDLSFIDNSGQPQSSLAYSLGQLDANEGAEEAAIGNCYKNIATQIKDLLENL